MIYILILQNPLKIQAYSSLAALIEDNSIENLKASESKLRKWDWNFNYVDYNVIISKREALTSGDIRRANQLVKSEYDKAYDAGLK